MRNLYKNRQNLKQLLPGLVLRVMVWRLTSPALEVDIPLPLPCLLSHQLRLRAKLYTVLSKQGTIGRELLLSVKCRKSNLTQRMLLSLQRTLTYFHSQLRSSLAHFVLDLVYLLGQSVLLRCLNFLKWNKDLKSILTFHLKQRMYNRHFSYTFCLEIF